MKLYYSKILIGGLTALAILATISCSSINSSIETASAHSTERPENAPPKALPTTAAVSQGDQTVVLAGGCFWGLEAVFEHVKGVRDVASGYSGGDAKSATYETVSTGRTGHAEAVKITFDPKEVSYEQLLGVFFAVAHDPTELNRQGPDTGTQYRSAIFYADDEQRRRAESVIKDLTAAHTYSAPIVTEIAPLAAFYQAEDYHQDYLAHHPDAPYIVANDQPKVADLKVKFPDLYQEK